MLRNSNINTVIEEFNALPTEDKEFAIDLIKRIYIEERREEIHKKARHASESLKKGKVKRGTLKDLFKDLEND